MEWPRSWSAPREPGQDIVSLKNLQLPHGVTAPDAWGKTKEQPCLLSITLLLRGSFASAGSKDQLDDSTVHYGKLAKALRAASQPDQTVGSLLSISEHGVVKPMCRRTDGTSCLAFDKYELVLPKASMFGQCGVVFYDTSGESNGGAHGSMGFYLKDLSLMCLVGVNAYERTGRQPLVVNFSLDSLPGQADRCFEIERHLVEIITETSFETLESLAGHVMDELDKKILGRFFSGATMQLRLEKPRAIAFAEAPGVEVMRTVP